MSDQSPLGKRLSPRSPLADFEHGEASGHPTTSGIAIRLIDGRSAISLATSPGAADELRRCLHETLGLILPEPGKCTRTTGAEMLWTGPMRWLVLADVGMAIEARLRALVGPGTAVVDQSGAIVSLTVEGRQARAALAKILPIDLHPRVFSPGDARSTTAGHMSVQIICATDAPAYTLLISRSTAIDFTRWLLASSAEFGVTLR